MSSQNQDQIKWNKKYSEKALDSWNSMPSEWLCRHEEVLLKQEKAKALDLACGNGRNSFFLAKLGFEVDAVDISDVAVSWLNEQIAERKIPVKTQVMDLEQEALPRNSYQVIICFNYLQRTLFSKINEALDQGGLLLYETVYLDEIEVLGGGMNPKFVLDYNELLHAFSELRILEYRENIVYSQRLNKQKALASLVARKL
ncbi:MAG: class I SAM-dependent methyltransferase [SAR324 cluster bacterium]|nr:class I SAM-dependent methyltransferase [SAR324 cluster bacterium]